MPVEGAPFRAELTAVAANWQLTFTADKKPRTIGAADLVRWGQCPEQGRGGTLVLADGGLLAADVVAADQQRLTADCEPLGTLKIPLRRSPEWSSAHRRTPSAAMRSWTASPKPPASLSPLSLREMGRG
jgi:hypothetical protein